MASIENHDGHRRRAMETMEHKPATVNQLAGHGVDGLEPRDIRRARVTRSLGRAGDLRMNDRAKVIVLTAITFLLPSGLIVMLQHGYRTWAVAGIAGPGGLCRELMGISRFDSPSLASRQSGTPARSERRGVVGLHVPGCAACGHLELGAVSELSQRAALRALQTAGARA